LSDSWERVVERRERRRHSLVAQLFDHCHHAPFPGVALPLSLIFGAVMWASGTESASILSCGSFWKCRAMWAAVIEGASILSSSTLAVHCGMSSIQQYGHASEQEDVQWVKQGLRSLRTPAPRAGRARHLAREPLGSLNSSF